MILEVTTPYGDRYTIDTATGRLTYARRNGQITEGSSQWLITGISKTGPGFGRRLPGGLLALEQLAEQPQEQILYKNRKPRYTLTDLDHGTHRTHGNPTHHGIKYVQRIKP